MISRMMSRLIEKAEVIAVQKNIPVLERLTMMMLSLNVSDGNFGQELLKQIHKPQNALMHQKMEKSLLFGQTVSLPRPIFHFYVLPLLLPHALSLHPPIVCRLTGAHP